jgi:hypothetical protein
VCEKQKKLKIANNANIELKNVNPNGDNVVASKPNNINSSFCQKL